MSVAKVIELSGSSKKSSDDAVRKIVKRAHKTINGVQSVWVKDVQAVVDNGRVTQWRVNCKVTFVLG